MPASGCSAGRGFVYLGCPTMGSRCRDRLCSLFLTANRTFFMLASGRSAGCGLIYFGCPGMFSGCRNIDRRPCIMADHTFFMLASGCSAGRILVYNRLICMFSGRRYHLRFLITTVFTNHLLTAFRSAGCVGNDILLILMFTLTISKFQDKVAERGRCKGDLGLLWIH